MDELTPLDQFDLRTQGDRHEREFWPLLTSRFPSYEMLWRRLIVPLTNRVDPGMAASPDKWIRFRPSAPERYEQMAMAHYSVFYFLGRAAKRLSEEHLALEYPEDVLFLLDSVGDNCKRFLQAMNRIGEDCGQRVFSASATQFPKGFVPFKEISDYRDTLLHDAVIGRGIEIGKVYLPKWNIDKSTSPLERARKSWRDAERLATEDIVCTKDLLERLIDEACCTLEKLWQQAIEAVTSPSFQRKMIQITGLAAYFPLKVQPPPPQVVPAASGTFVSLGSNTNVIVQPARGEKAGGDLCNGGLFLDIG